MARKAEDIWMKAMQRQLAAAVVQAEPLVAEGQFDEAERLVRAVNSDIYGALALGELYTKALGRCERRGYQAEALYGRALRWASAWPGIHTDEEAATERAHVESVRRELDSLIGSLPQ